MKLSILYARSTSGKISTWQIEYTENNYRTISGFQHMTLTTSAWTECEGKSYNNTSEQTEKEAKAIHRKKIEGGMFENINDVDNETFTEPMLAKDWHKEKSKVKYPLFSQPKLDGIRCIIKLGGMWSRAGKRIISAPHIYESLKPLFEANSNLILDGELFAPRDTCDFNKIISCVRKTKPEPEDLVESKKYIQYWVYDLPSHNSFFSSRNAELNKLKFPKCCVVVETNLIYDEKEVDIQYAVYMKQGFEGQILRTDGYYENKRSKSLLKHKTFFDKEYKILGVDEGVGKLAGKVGILKFDGFNSAVNGDHEYLEMLFKKGNLVGKMATVKYFELTTDGKPRFPKVIAIRDYE